MARVARGRGARFGRDETGRLVCLTPEILTKTAEDVAAWLGFPSVAAYDAATPEERLRRVMQARQAV